MWVKNPLLRSIDMNDLQRTSVIRGIEEPGVHNTPLERKSKVKESRLAREFKYALGLLGS